MDNRHCGGHIYYLIITSGNWPKAHLVYRPGHDGHARQRGTGRKTCCPKGKPQTPRRRRSRTHPHQSRRRPDALQLSVSGTSQLCYYLDRLLWHGATGTRLDQGDGALRRFTQPPDNFTRGGIDFAIGGGDARVTTRSAVRLGYLPLRIKRKCIGC